MPGTVTQTLNSSLCVRLRRHHSQFKLFSAGRVNKDLSTKGNDVIRGILYWNSCTSLGDPQSVFRPSQHWVRAVTESVLNWVVYSAKGVIERIVSCETYYIWCSGVVIVCLQTILCHVMSEVIKDGHTVNSTPHHVCCLNQCLHLNSAALSMTCLAVTPHQIGKCKNECYRKIITRTIKKVHANSVYFYFSQTGVG